MVTRSCIILSRFTNIHNNNLLINSKFRKFQLLLANNQKLYDQQNIKSLQQITNKKQYFSSSSNNNSNSNPSWYVGTFVVTGIVFWGINTYLPKLLQLDDKNSNIESSSTTNNPMIVPPAEITSRAYMDISIDQIPAGRIIIGLHGSVVPKTVHNFETLCNGNQMIGNTKLSYEKSTFHRIIPNFMIQGGDFTKHNGTGGRSIYGTIYNGQFPDENFTLKHIGPGVLSMANSGKDTNGSQFFITTTKTSHLDKRHVVFGTIIDGYDIIQKIESYGNNSGKPTAKIVIEKCGILPNNIEDNSDTK